MDTTAAAQLLTEYAHAACIAAARARQDVHGESNTEDMPVKGFKRIVDPNLIERMIGADALAAVWLQVLDEMGTLPEADATARTPLANQKPEAVVAAVRRVRSNLMAAVVNRPPQERSGMDYVSDLAHRRAVASFMTKSNVVELIDELVAEAPQEGVEPVDSFGEIKLDLKLPEGVPDVVQPNLPGSLPVRPDSVRMLCSLDEGETQWRISGLAVIGRLVRGEKLGRRDSLPFGDPFDPDSRVPEWLLPMLRRRLDRLNGRG